ncbi:MAG: SiaB family protein kinase [Spirochaetales bacterium]|nr:SiaB family protein kinase [Spirochaetales bacterium]
MKVDNLTEEEICFSYSGSLRQELLEEQSEIIKARIRSDVPPACMTRCQTVYIEMVQNIIRYSLMKKEKDSETGEGAVLIAIRDKSLVIMAENRVDAYHRAMLEESLNRLMHLDKCALSHLFRQQLRGKVHAKGRGAGLGLIEIFRIADKVDYFFSTDEKKDIFFSMKAEIDFPD